MVLGVLLGIVMWARAYVTQIGAIDATKKIHQEMIEKVLEAPVNLYFDVTPIGQILNRFSKDLSQLESQMGFQISRILI